MVGQDIPTLIHGRSEDGQPLERDDLPISVALKTGTSQTGDNEVFWHKDGQVVPVQYLCSPLHEGNMVTGAVVVFRNVAEARAIAKKMDYLATHDNLTGLLNRWAFENRLNQAIEITLQDKIQHVLAYIDLDQFKIVNDTCGHPAGDELLRQISNLLRNQLRKTDIFARLGGDEFGLLLHNCTRQKAMEVIEKLHACLKTYRFVWRDKSFSVGASIGVVVIGDGIQDLGNALSAADAACYVAKDNGRNRIYVYQHDDDSLTQRHSDMELVSQIKEALENGSFSLLGQTIVSVESPEQDMAIEFLLRMHSRNEKMVSPASFIPVAERYYLMPEIDRWVVHHALDWLMVNHAKLPHLKLFSINLSGQSINDENFLGFVLELLAAWPIPHEMLCFEITETAAVDNLTRAVEFIKTIKQHGCRFALDDFGSGMSSFTYLKHLPIDFLKIDGNFVRNILQDRIDFAMVKTIHHVGNLMGIQTIAEYVENREILGRLREIGVTYAQGYGIGKPVPLSKFI